jgi:hypothetical protein
MYIQEISKEPPDNKISFGLTFFYIFLETIVTVRPSRNTAVTQFHKDEITMEGGKLPGM